MKRIRISFEYQCCPVWVYDEDGYLLCNGLPDGMQADEALTALCGELQDMYDALFVDDGKVFEYLGFASEAERDRVTAACGNAFILQT